MFVLNSQKMLFEMPDNKAIITSFENGLYLESNALGSYVINQINNGVDVEEILMQIRGCVGCPDDISDKIYLPLFLVMSIAPSSSTNAPL